MANPKLEPRLQEQLRSVEALGETTRRLPVLIEVFSTDVLEPPMDYERMKDRAETVQKGVVDALAGFGATHVRPLVLANGIGAQITPRQIREIANRPDVRMIHLTPLERATTDDNESSLTENRDGHFSRVDSRANGPQIGGNPPLMPAVDAFCATPRREESGPG